MSSRGIFQALFILYCAEAGAFLLLAPWSPVWDRAIGNLLPPLLATVYASPYFRGAISGLGAVHLLWGVHDLEAWLSRRK